MTTATAFNKPSEILIAAKAVIADPKHWIKRALARDKQGNLCKYNSGNAVCFCSVGAYYKVAGYKDDTLEATQAFGYLVKAAETIDPTAAISDINDRNDHATVMQMWDKAIELAKAAE